MVFYKLIQQSIQRGQAPFDWLEDKGGDRLATLSQLMVAFNGRKKKGNFTHLKMDQAFNCAKRWKLQVDCRTGYFIIILGGKFATRLNVAFCRSTLNCSNVKYERTANVPHVARGPRGWNEILLNLFDWTFPISFHRGILCNELRQSSSRSLNHFKNLFRYHSKNITY